MLGNRRWFTAAELQKRWEITDIDLWDMMKRNELKPYFEKDGEISPFYEDWVSKFTLDTHNRVVVNTLYWGDGMPLFSSLLFRAPEILSLEGEAEEQQPKREESKSRTEYTYLTSEELMDRWGMTKTELVDITTRETIPRYFYYSGDIVDVEKLSQDAVLTLTGRWPIPTKDWVFRLTDVERLEETIADLRKNEPDSLGERDLVERLREKLAAVTSERDDWKGKAEAFGAETQTLDGKDRQELGRLRLQKERWDDSIKASVHAALLCRNGKIKRDELKDKLHKFHLPDTVIESIWKALREKGLTKKAGRPPGSNK